MHKQFEIIISFQDKCPECHHPLKFINAVNTESKLFMIYCSNCKFQKEFQLITDLEKNLQVK